VSPNTIISAKMHARVNGYGCPPLFKPPMRRHIITNEQEAQFEVFIADKTNQKFHIQYPNGIGRTTFFNKLRNSPFIYREDLGGLCLTCNQYGFEMFHELSNYIIKEVENNEKKISHALKHYVRLSFDITSREDIEKAIENLSGTSVANINPNRAQRASIKIGTILGNSDLYEWC
ncbi:4205_t:CDS:2, partial [Scutellospora calospora]